MLTYISNTDHYNLVLSRVASVRKSLWIGTADIKDLYVKVGNGTLPFLAVLAAGAEGRGGTAHPRQGAGTGLPRGLRQVPVVSERVRAGALSPRPLQDAGLRR